MGVWACLGDLQLAAPCCSVSSHLLHALSARHSWKQWFFDPRVAGSIPARPIQGLALKDSYLSVLFNQEATEHPHLHLHDRALHQDVPGESEGVGVAQSGLERDVGG